MSHKLRLVSGVAALSALLALSACTQMTKHSNTLVFGTDTTIGLKVGQDANQIPNLEIGYNRQEAAFVPLLANTAVGDSRELAPCPGVVDVSGGVQQVTINDCHFRATHSGVDKDSYSTIASFGSETAASIDSNGNEGEVAVAQYFATGIAAQHLVLTGGANIVQAGGDTRAKAEAAADTAEVIATERATAFGCEQSCESIDRWLTDADGNRIAPNANALSQCMEDNGLATGPGRIAEFTFQEKFKPIREICVATLDIPIADQS